MRVVVYGRVLLVVVVFVVGGCVSVNVGDSAVVVIVIILYRFNQYLPEHPKMVFFCCFSHFCIMLQRANSFMSDMTDLQNLLT